MRRVSVALLAVLALCAVEAPRAAAVHARASIVGGTPIQIEQAPWQIFLRIGADEGCGGSVLDATRVLTAAHLTTAASRGGCRTNPSCFAEGRFAASDFASDVRWRA